MDEKKPQRSLENISDEEIGRMLAERRAGLGDSPYTQEAYEELYGLGKKEDREMDRKAGEEGIDY